MPQEWNPAVLTEYEEEIRTELEREGQERVREGLLRILGAGCWNAKSSVCFLLSRHMRGNCTGF